jgi:putative ABC transport system permease protein
MFGVAVKMLLHSKVRSISTLLGIAVAFVLSAAQIGLMVSWCNTVSAIVRHADADVWVMADKTPAFDYGTPIPEGRVYQVRSAAGVSWAESLFMSWMFVRQHDGRMTIVELVGVDNDLAGGPWAMSAGNLSVLLEPDAIIVNKLYAKQLGVSAVNDELEISDRRAIVRGFSEGVRTITAAPFVFTSIRSALEWDPRYRDDEVTYVLARGRDGTSPEQLRDSIASVVPSVEVLTSREFVARTLSYWLFDTGLGLTVIATAILGLVVGTVIISQSLYAITNDHLPNYATLLAVGFGRWQLVLIVMVQAILLGIVGVALGSAVFGRMSTLSKATPIPIEMTPMRVLMGVDGNEEIAFDSLMVTGSAAYRLANPTAHTPEPINFGNFHVGDTAPSQALSLTNDVPNDGFSEALNASIGSPTGGVTTNSGSFSLLAPGATNDSSLVVGIDTATAGDKSGTATITLASDGTGGNGQTPLPSQVVNVTGSVFRLASASAPLPEPVDFGILHVGDPVPTRLLTLTNLAPDDGFSERLNATIENATGDATTNNGAFSELMPGGTDNTSLSVGIDTSSAGNKSGTATIALTSTGTGTSGLDNTPLASQIVNVSATINNFAVADIVKLSGDGTFTMIAANEFRLDLGSTLRGSADLAAELGVVNDAAAPADDLAGDFMLTAADFVSTGFEAFTGLTAGNTLGGLSILLDSATVGTFDGQIVLQPRSTNPNPFTMDLPAITIHLTGEVRLPGDYNFDGTVDAADYVMWRKTGINGPTGYDTWRTNFSEPGGSGSGASANAIIPEPTTLVILIFAAVGGCLRRGRAA